MGRARKNNKQFSVQGIDSPAFVKQVRSYAVELGSTWHEEKQKTHIDTKPIKYLTK